jgi:Fe-S-cluster containining protein
MVTDLIQIRRQGEQLREENGRLRVHLKTHNFVERRLKKIALEIQEAIDCTTCANCCKVATTSLIDRDVERLARFLRLSKEQFLERYTMRDEENELVLKWTEETGCVFLAGNLCTVYEARPSNCENFPHLIRGNGSIQNRMWAMIDRSCYCPIVFNTLEAWKKDLDFSPRAR